jgi:hypothetical protein
MQNVEIQKVVKRGRPSKQSEVKVFDPSSVQLLRGSDLKFNDSLFQPMKTNSEVDVILSTEGVVMHCTNILLVGCSGTG